MLDESYVDFNVSHNVDVPKESPDRNKSHVLGEKESLNLNLLCVL